MGAWNLNTTCVSFGWLDTPSIHWQGGWIPLRSWLFFGYSISEANLPVLGCPSQPSSAPHGLVASLHILYDPGEEKVTFEFGTSKFWVSWINQECEGLLSWYAIYIHILYIWYENQIWLTMMVTIWNPSNNHNPFWINSKMMFESKEHENYQTDSTFWYDCDTSFRFACSMVKKQF